MKFPLMFAEPSRLMTTRKQCIKSQALRRILALYTGISLLSLTGCLQRYEVWTDWYSPPRITPLAGLDAVAVYRFTDNRPEEDSWVGKDISHTLRNTYTTMIYVSEPVAVTLTQAFADGLKARGVPVIDVTNTKFDPVKSKPNAQVAVSGAILELWHEKEEVIFDGERGYARCKVMLRAYDTSTGRKFWEKEYAKTHTFGHREPQREPRYKSPLDQVVAETVEEAVYDPEFILAIGRKRYEQK